MIVRIYQIVLSPAIFALTFHRKSRRQALVSKRQGGEESVKQGRKKER
jgi:hypothetical protein